MGDPLPAELVQGVSVRCGEYGWEVARFPAALTMAERSGRGTDLQREFHLARSQPRHLAPQPKAPNSSQRVGLDGVVDSLLFAQHAIEMFRRSLTDGAPKHRLDQLANRLTKILAETRKLNPTG